MSLYKNKEKRLAYVRSWRSKNRDKLRIQNRKIKKKNRDKILVQVAIRYKRDSQKILDRIRFKKYGITGEKFRAILKKQEMKCPICQRLMNKNLSVDHNHITKKIRRIICNNCDLSIGNAADSPDRLRAMANYLEKNG